MIDLLKKALTLLLAVWQAIPAVRRARERRELREAIAEHDEAKTNRLWQQRRDRR